jgi:hypothetical protein
MRRYSRSLHVKIEGIANEGVGVRSCFTEFE